MRVWWRSLFARKGTADARVDEVNQLRAGYGRLNDEELKLAGRLARTLPEVVAVTAVVAARVLGVTMFEVQVQGALALADGHIVEMQTGEGKTLAAVPAIVWHARSGLGVHVLTANDYLAERDATWMRDIYDWLGLSVGAIHRGMTESERRDVYQKQVTYATANEVGFDYLRDGLALQPHEQVHRPFAAAVIDEADSILIDEARVPLIIAGGAVSASGIADEADRAVRELVPGHHFLVEHHARAVTLTPAGVAAVERALGCSNLFDSQHLTSHTAVQDALHAHALLKKDVDYMVSNGAIIPIDEFKGRVVRRDSARPRNRPAGARRYLERGRVGAVERRARGRTASGLERTP